MPLYEYKCSKCGHRFEKIEGYDAPARPKCPKCGARAGRLLSSSAIQFKGSGWYVSDYGRAGAKPPGEGKEASAEGKEAPASGESKPATESKETTVSDTKSADSKSADSKKPAKKSPKK